MTTFIDLILLTLNLIMGGGKVLRYSVFWYFKRFIICFHYVPHNWLRQRPDDMQNYIDKYNLNCCYHIEAKMFKRKQNQTYLTQTIINLNIQFLWMKSCKTVVPRNFQVDWIVWFYMVSRIHSYMSLISLRRCTTFSAH